MTEATEIPVEVRALDVVVPKRTANTGDGAVHRLEDGQCGNAPNRSTGAETDLETAAVWENTYRCSRCEWPERSAEVLE